MFSHRESTAIGVRSGLERLEGDDGPGVLNSRYRLHLFVDEVADVGFGVDIKFHQQVEITGGRIDFRGDFRFGELVRHLIGLAELAFDLNEKRLHANSALNFGKSSKKVPYWQG